MRISWTAKKSNEEVMETSGYKRFLLETIRKRTTVLGHINRADGLEKQLWRGEICGWYQNQRKTTHRIGLHRQFELLRNKNRISSGELTTERIGRSRSLMSAADLAHDGDDDILEKKMLTKPSIFIHTRMAMSEI